MDKDVKNLDEYGCHEIRDLVDPKADEEIYICSNYRHKTTLHCAEREAKLLGQWTIQHLSW